MRDAIGHMYGYSPGAYIRMAVQGRTIHYHKKGVSGFDLMHKKCSIQVGPLLQQVYDNGLISIYETKDEDALDGEPVVVDQTACARRCANVAAISYKLKGFMIGPNSEIDDLTDQESSYRCHCIMSSFCPSMIQNSIGSVTQLELVQIASIPMQGSAVYTATPFFMRRIRDPPYEVFGDPTYTPANIRVQGMGVLTTILASSKPTSSAHMPDRSYAYASFSQKTPQKCVESCSRSILHAWTLLRPGGMSDLVNTTHPTNSATFMLKEQSNSNNATKAFVKHGMNTASLLSTIMRGVCSNGTISDMEQRAGLALIEAARNVDPQAPACIVQSLEEIDLTLNTLVLRLLLLSQEQMDTLKFNGKSTKMYQEILQDTLQVPSNDAFRNTHMKLLFSSMLPSTQSIPPPFKQCDPNDNQTLMQSFLFNLSYSLRWAYLKPSSVDHHTSGLQPLGDAVRQCQRSVMEVLLALSRKTDDTSSIGSKTTLLRVQPTLRLIAHGQPKDPQDSSMDAQRGCRCLSSGTHENIQVDNDNGLFQFYESMLFQQRLLLWTQSTRWKYVNLLVGSPVTQYGTAPPCIAQDPSWNPLTLVSDASMSLTDQSVYWFRDRYDPYFHETYSAQGGWCGIANDNYKQHVFSMYGARLHKTYSLPIQHDEGADQRCALA